jgi:hypothetical protein
MRFIKFCLISITVLAVMSLIPFFELDKMLIARIPGNQRAPKVIEYNSKKENDTYKKVDEKIIIEPIVQSELPSPSPTCVHISSTSQ